MVAGWRTKPARHHPTAAKHSARDSLWLRWSGLRDCAASLETPSTLTARSYQEAT